MFRVSTYYIATLSTFIEDYVVIGKQEDNHIVSSFESLSNEDIVMLKGDSLYNYFSNNSKANIKTYNNIEELVENGEKNII